MPEALIYIFMQEISRLIDSPYLEGLERLLLKVTIYQQVLAFQNSQNRHNWGQEATPEALIYIFI